MGLSSLLGTFAVVSLVISAALMRPPKTYSSKSHPAEVLTDIWSKEVNINSSLFPLLLSPSFNLSFGISVCVGVCISVWYECIARRLLSKSISFLLVEREREEDCITSLFSLFSSLSSSQRISAYAL
jgi:hypothetical protein